MGVVVAAFVLALGATVGTAGTSPTLRVGTTTTLSLVGTGFTPRVLVTLRVVAPDFSRRVVVRAGAKGGFTARFPGLDRCATNMMIARAANGTGARVPISWWIRECPPPPPLQPGVAGAA